MPPRPSKELQDALDIEEMEEVKYASYAELRSWCRQVGVSGAGKADVLKERVLEALEKRQRKDAKAAEKDAKAAEAASHIPLSDEPKSPKSGVKRRHRKLSMLQQEAQGAAEAAGEQAEQVEDKAEDIAHVVRDAAVKGAKDLNAAWDAAKEQIAPVTERPISETRAEAANYASNVLSRLQDSVAGWVPSGTSWRLLLVVFLLGTLAGAGLTMLAHPHAWQDVRHRTNAVVTTATDGAGTIYRSASQAWSEAFPRGQWANEGSDGRVPLHCRAALAGEALPMLLPPPDAGLWGHVAADVRALSPLEGGAPLRKGLGLLLVCSTAQQCAAAVQGLRTHVPEPCTDCLLVIQGGELAGGTAEVRGQLQQRLVTTLQRCPYAAIVLDTATIAAAPEAGLPVLINALSEQGHFQQDGQQIPTSSAVYVVTMALPAGDSLTAAAAAAGEDAFKSAAKAALVQVLSGSEGASTSGLAEALRRRLDVVAPARGSGLYMQAAVADGT